MTETLPIKVVLLGETAVGKSSFISRFVSDSFLTNHVPTMTGYYFSKNVFYDKVNKEIKYEIWDTAGQERYRSINKMFYRDASVALLMLDITRRDTFEAIKNYWYSEVKESSPKNVIIAIVANKSDLYEYEEITNNELEEYAQSINAIYKQTSALNNSGIKDLFDQIGYKLLSPDNYEVFIRKTNSRNQIKLTPPKNEEKENDADDDADADGSKINKINNKGKKSCC